jgi:prepilin-type N-terminal cleavage/methylation domain-containing protein
MKRLNSAFTLLELVMVVVVIGIISVLAIPRLDRDLREEAQTNVLNAIRYTQHLSLMDNKHMLGEKNWHRRFWQIAFGQCTTGNWFYKIGSDDDMGGNGEFSKDEAAIDGATALPYFWSAGTPCSSGGNGAASEDIFITKKYGIGAVNFSGGCSNGQYIGFDNLGRPHVNFGSSSNPDHSSYMKTDCNITFSFKDASIAPFSIIISKETGSAYAY